MSKQKAKFFVINLFFSKKPLHWISLLPPEPLAAVSLAYQTCLRIEAWCSDLDAAAYRGNGSMSQGAGSRERTCGHLRNDKDIHRRRPGFCALCSWRSYDASPYISLQGKHLSLLTRRLGVW